MSDASCAGDQVDIDPSQVTAMAQTFDAEANGLSEAIGSLTEQLGALGNCWGNDQPGTAFGGEYTQHESNFVNGCGSVVTGLEDVSTRLQEMAQAVLTLGNAKTIG
jgi:uncharacterized protein YukE